MFSNIRKNLHVPRETSNFAVQTIKKTRGMKAKEVIETIKVAAAEKERLCSIHVASDGSHIIVKNLNSAVDFDARKVRAIECADSVIRVLFSGASRIVIGNKIMYVAI